MQRQVVGVVQHVAETRAGIVGVVVGIVQLTPAPAGPRLLGRQLQHVAPEHGTADAGAAVLALQPHQDVGHAGEVRHHVAGSQIGHQNRTQPQHHGRARRLALVPFASRTAPVPPRQQHQQHRELHQSGAGQRECHAHRQRQHQQPGQQRASMTPQPAPDKLLQRTALPQIPERPERDVHQRGVLVALAQVAVDLSGRGMVDQIAQPGRVLEILQQADAGIEQACQ